MIIITNCTDGSTLSYPLALLEGTISNSKHQNRTIEAYTDHDNTIISWPIVASRFKVLISLKDGLNHITVQSGFYSSKISVTYRDVLALSRYYVQPLYIIPRDHDGTFQAPAGMDNSIESALRRISFGARLMQTFTSVSLLSHNLSPRTFQLKNDEDSSCTLVFHSKLSTDELTRLSGRDLWSQIAKEIMASNLPEKRYCKFIAFLSSTRYNGHGWSPAWRHSDVLNNTKCHVALGGGGLALLGSGTLYSWAESLCDLVPCLTDETKVDQSLFMDDSAYRGTYWANYATGLGAALHELGHTFDLNHTKSGIMARGFDNIHRMFVLDGAQPVPQPPADKLSRIRQLQTKLNSSHTPDVMKQSAGQDLKYDALITRTISVHQVQPISQVSLPVHSTEYSKPGSQSPEIRCNTNNQPAANHPAPVAALPSTEITDSSSGLSDWSAESAVMLRYSRWLLDGDDIQKYKNGERLSRNLSIIQSPSGIRTIQLYSKCMDTVIRAHNYILEGPASVDLSAIFPPDNVCQRCHQKACTEILIRDSIGHFMKFSG